MAATKDSLSVDAVKDLLVDGLREAGVHDLEVDVKDESDGCGQSIVIIVVSDEFGKFAFRLQALLRHWPCLHHAI